METTEKILHYLWSQRLLGEGTLHTTQGDSLLIKSAGIESDGADKPHFYRASLVIGGEPAEGCVSIAATPADWEAIKQRGPLYAHTILLLTAQEPGEPPTLPDGRPLPTLTVSPTATLRLRYQSLAQGTPHPHCANSLAAAEEGVRSPILQQLLSERLDARRAQIFKRLAHYNQNWEEAFFCTLARNFGFGSMGDAFEEWMQHIPQLYAARHRDNQFQLEAIFLGQAGLLQPGTVPVYYRAQAESDGYLSKLSKEYDYLAHKFDLQPLNPQIWQLSRPRPGGNFPHARIARLAALYHRERLNLSRMLECDTATQMYDLLDTPPSEYWCSHATFGSTPRAGSGTLSRGRINLLLINTVIPFLYTYGTYKHEPKYCERATELLSTIKAEDNRITREWSLAGIEPRNAGESQALVQLKRCHCDTGDCLGCPVGRLYMSHLC